jgi:hypothetical protein
MPTILRAMLGTIDPHEQQAKNLSQLIRNLVNACEPVQSPDITHGEEDFASQDKQEKWAKHSALLIELMLAAAGSFAP